MTGARRSPPPASDSLAGEEEEKATRVKIQMEFPTLQKAFLKQGKMEFRQSGRERNRARKQGEKDEDEEPFMLINTFKGDPGESIVSMAVSPNDEKGVHLVR